MGLNALSVRAQGFDISSWAINYGRDILGVSNITDKWEDCPKTCGTLTALDVFEHMPLEKVRAVLSEVSAKSLLVRMPVCNADGEDFALEVSRRDKTHITCLTKTQWGDLFAEYGYRLETIIAHKTIWDAEGALCRLYVKSGP